MNFSDFCNERGYTHFIGLTYNIDLNFFESIVLDRLVSVGTTNILVCCDPIPLQKSLLRISSHLRSLGRQFILQPIKLGNGAFHPKVYLKIGQSSAKVFVGSGNLTFGGMGGNKEIYSTWNIPKEKYHLLNDVLSFVEKNASNPLVMEFIEEIRRDYGIQGSSKDDQPKNIILNSTERTLSEIIESRWKNKKFNKLTVFTGSTDEKGAFLNWCNKKFGIKECLVVANEESISFQKEHLEKLPLKVKFAFIPSEQLNHSKIYLFENKNNEVGVIAGSPNCSSAAWLLNPVQGGNIEAITIFDNVEKDKLKVIKDEIPDEVVESDKVSFSKPDPKPKDSTANRYNISELYFDLFNEKIILKLDEPKNFNGKIAININSNKIYLSSIQNEFNVWQTEKISLDGKSNIVLVEFEDKGEIIEKYHWIDIPDEIRNFSINYKIRSTISGISQASNLNDYRRLLGDLSEIQAIIFDNSYYHSKKVTKFIDEEAAKENEDETSENVSPEMIIKSISDFSNKSTNYFNSSIASISFSGIIKYLFDDFSGETEDSEKEDEEKNNKSGDQNSRKGAGQEGKPKQLPKKDAERIYNKLESFVEDLIRNIQNKDFYDECTARQLADAVAYCLMVSNRVLHKTDKFLPLANRLLFEVLHTLFYMKIDDLYELGIFNYTLDRYREQQKEKEFYYEIQQGYLWIALLYSIVTSRSENPSTILQNTIILKYIYNNQDLYNKIDPAKLGIFSSQQDLKENLKKLFSRLPNIIYKFNLLEQHFCENFETLKVQSINKFNVGQIIYNKTAGWAKVIENYSDKMKVLCFSDGRIICIKHDYIGYWISPKLLRFSKNEESKLFKSLEKEYDN